MPEQSSGPGLERRLQALELELESLRRGRRRATAVSTPRPSRARRILGSLGVILTLALLPMVAVASDTFTDVATGNQFHDAINNLYNARITRGCTTTPPLMFCPQDEVNRQQMAGFLSRGLGRATGAQNQIDVTADTLGVDVVEVTVDTGGLTGGTGFVLVTGSVTGFTTNGSTCPCTLGLRVANVTEGEEPDLFEFTTVPNTTSPWIIGDFRFGTASMSWVFSVPSGESQTFALRTGVDMTGATGNLTLQGHLTAQYVPFGGSGGSTLGEITTTTPSTNGLAD